MSDELKTFDHVPVLPDKTIELLDIKEDGIYVDGTAGGGGHSERIAKKLKNGRLICIDRDSDAIEHLKRRLGPYEDRVTIVKSNYTQIRNVLGEYGIEKADGILLDLGVSSYQLDTPERGFSYVTDAPLDMRMDRSSSLDARTVVNTYSEAELYRIIRDYGEDRFAKNIAKHICLDRSVKPIETTLELAQTIKKAIPLKVQKTGKKPAMRTFQAIRIEVNDELGGLETALEECVDLLKEGGRLAVITFHSLEDRMVKVRFKEYEDPCICPPNFPVCVCGRKPKGRIITKKAIVPDEKELGENTRSHSAKLRVFEKGQSPKR